MSSVSRSLSLVQDIISAFLAAMLMALCAMPRRLLFMSWSSMTCSLRRLTSAESAGEPGAGAAGLPPLLLLLPLLLRPFRRVRD